MGVHDQMGASDQTERGTGSELICLERSPIHGRGGFAKKALPQGSLVIEYVGERIGKRESRRRRAASNEYIFCLDETQDIDGAVDWNPARFINHSCSPNCDAELIGGQIWIVARRDIKAGEEITFNYGYDVSEYHDFPCHCGSPNCVGFIVDELFFAEVRNRNGGESARRATPNQNQGRHIAP